MPRKCARAWAAEKAFLSRLRRAEAVAAEVRGHDLFASLGRACRRSAAARPAESRTADSYLEVVFRVGLVAHEAVGQPFFQAEIDSAWRASSRCSASSLP